MDKFLLSILILCFCNYETTSLKLPGPLVYVVTPAPPQPQAEEARAAPFYYHNWIRRMDSPRNATTSTTPKTKTPDLIFAEFESGNNMKSIRKLLEKEKFQPKTSTTTSTSRPFYMPEESNDVKYISPIQADENMKKEKPVDMTDYFALYNNMYNSNSEALAPVYMPSTKSSTTVTTTTTTTTANPAPKVENIWHIIDSHKYDQYPGQWEEEPLANEGDKTTTNKPESQTDDDSKIEIRGQKGIDENFALPGFATNSGIGAENESRAIYKEHNMRFPYINLKPFQMKTEKKPVVNSISNNKKGNNMFTSSDNFHDIKNPVRGEAQDVVLSRQPIDRYNPAQPYLPDQRTKPKQSSPSARPIEAVSNLVPPPPPPPPRINDGNFPAPSNYEPFPPYAPIDPPATPPPPPSKPVVIYQPPVESSDDSEQDSSFDDSDDPPIDLEYHYKPPSPPAQTYIPTQPPLAKPSVEYSYDKPPPKPHGGYSYDSPPANDDGPAPDDTDEKLDYQGYHYSKPEAPPPPPPPPVSYSDDTPSYGFPQDLPVDLKYHHDHDDHYHDYHHDYHPYHYPKPTTTTTEMPRVNRYSYYYLGKKLYYLPLYFSVYFIVYVGALIIKAVLRHKIVYPNSWRPNDQTATFFSKRSVDSLDLSNENLHEITGKVTHAIAVAGEKYFSQKKKKITKTR